MLGVTYPAKLRRLEDRLERRNPVFDSICYGNAQSGHLVCDFALNQSTLSKADRVCSSNYEVIEHLHVH